MSDLVVIRRGGELEIEGLFDGLSDDTRRAYHADLQRFAEYANQPAAREAVVALIEMGAGRAHEKVHKWRADMLKAGKSPATINRALSSIRSVMRLARQFGYCSWYLEITGVKAQKYRDTRGPGGALLNKALHLIADQPPRRRARDAALLRLLFDLGLRRIEIERLDLFDLQLGAKRLAIRGKGRREKELLTLPDETCAALSEWLTFRGTDPGPLFVNFDNGGRLLGDGIYRIMTAYGKQLGAPLRPHGVRHTAITAALDRANGDMRRVQRFSRHKNVQTLKEYDDNRTDMGGQIAADLASTLKGGDGE